MALNSNEQAGRNYLKDTKPLVYDKVVKFKEKYDRGESIAIIQLQYNYICNMKCEHCSIKEFQGEKDKRIITPADVKNLADQADAMGLARFVISGGEPTVFPDLDDIVKAIGPERFYINCDTNGYLLEKKAEHLKEIGIDRMQLSIDSLDAKAHDDFRGMPGAYEHALLGIKECQRIGLPLYIQTVVDRPRLYSDEFKEFLEYFNGMGLMVFVSYAKPVGAWARHYDNLVKKEDFAYMHELEQKYRVCTHLTPAYELDMGCIGVKGFITVTRFGDVQPCPYIHTSIGNILDTPLKDIIQRGLDIKFFGEHVDTCLIAEDMNFIKKYVEPHIYDRKDVPVPCDEIFTEEDRTLKPYWIN